MSTPFGKMFYILGVLKMQCLTTLKKTIQKNCKRNFEGVRKDKFSTGNIHLPIYFLYSILSLLIWNKIVDFICNIKNSNIKPK